MHAVEHRHGLLRRGGAINEGKPEAAQLSSKCTDVQIIIVDDQDCFGPEVLTNIDLLAGKLVQYQTNVQQFRAMFW